MTFNCSNWPLKVFKLTFVGPPQTLHAMSHQDDSGEFGERLSDVEVTEWADLKEGDAQLLCIHLRLLRGHLTLVGQVETVPHQDLRHTWGMLGKQKTERHITLVLQFVHKP